MSKSRRVYWALRYVNGDYYIGRYDGHWTRTSDLDCAALYDSETMADSARQGFIESSREKMAEGSAPQWLFDVVGGVLEVQQIERILQPVEA